MTTPEGGGLPPGQPFVSPDDLASITPLWQQALVQQVLPVVAQVWQASSGVVHAQMVDATGVAGLPAVGSLASEQYLAKAASALEDVGGDLWETARAQLLDGFAKGESVPELADRLKQSAGMTAKRAVLVARTQILDASNAGSYATAQASGLELKKGWLATPDNRTRATHVAAGEQYGDDANMIPLGDKFNVGGYQCDRPHDMTLPAEEKYNCRCALIYAMVDAAVRDAFNDAVPAAPLPGTSTAEVLAAEPGPLVVAPAVPLVVRAGLEVRSVLASARTQSAVSRVFGREAERITGRPFPFPQTAIDFQGSAATAREHAEGLLRGLERFPDAQLRRVNTIPLVADTYAQHSAGVLSFNYRWAKPSARREYLDALRSDVAGWETSTIEYGEDVFTGWHPRGTGNPIGVALHEFGHLLDVETTAKAIRPELDAVLTRRAAPYVAKGLGQDAMIRREVSEYATRSREELVAEAFSDVMVNGDAASGLSREIFDLLEAEYRRGGGVVGEVGPVEVLASVPKPAGLAGQSVPQLRALAKERGITGYSKLTKPQLLERLSVEAEPVGVVGPGPAEMAAGVRQAAIDAARKVADLATQVMGDLANEATPAAIRSRIVATADRLGTPARVRNALLRAVDTGDPEQVAAAVGKVVKAAKLEPTGGIVGGKPGELVQFNPAAHQPIGGSIRQGTHAEVVRPGYTLTHQGEKIRLSKPVVEELSPAEAEAARKAATRAAARERNRVIEAKASVEKALAHLDELIAKKADRALFDQALRHVEGLGEKDVAVLRAAAGSPTKLRAAITRISKREGITPEAKAGTKVAYNPVAHEPVGAVPAEGVPVQVIRRGSSVTIEGQPIQLQRALVKLAGPTREEAIAKAKAFLDTTPKPSAAQLRKAGVTKAPAPTGLVKYDPAKHDYLGAASLRGGKLVRIEHPGYSIEHQGETIIVQKPIVSRAGLSGRESVESGDFADLKRVGTQGGSNPGGIFEAADGTKWYIKQANEDWAREQSLASALYREVGVDTPEIFVGSGLEGLGDYQIATRYMPNLTEDRRFVSANRFVAHVRNDFAADAWLADWDVGQAGNILGRKPFDTAEFRVPVRVDIGGSLRFRARGGVKGEAFGPSVTEWTTMRDPRNVSGHLFDNMSYKELADSVSRVQKIGDAKIRRLVAQQGLDRELGDLLIARRDDLVARLEQERIALTPAHFEPGDIIARGEGERLATEAVRVRPAFEGMTADPLLSAIAKIQGFDSLPTVVAKAELRKMGDVRLYRGMQESGGLPGERLTAAQIQEQLRTGPAYHGNGIYGNGYYFTTRRATAVRYSDSTPGALVEATLRRDAKIIEYDEARVKWAEEISSGEAGNFNEVYSDPGRWAAAHGYDAMVARKGSAVFGVAIEHEGELYYIVLNRGALIVESAP